jgi:hypothetical protein
MHSSRKSTKHGWPMNQSSQRQIKHTYRLTLNSLLSLAILCGPVVSISAWRQSALGQDEFEKRSTWSPPAAAQVRGELDVWLAQQTFEEEARQRIAALWNQPGEVEGPELLDRVVETVAMALPAARKWVNDVQADQIDEAVLKSALITDEKQPGVVRNNLRLFLGQRWTQRAFYDEALEAFGALEPNQVADPASLLFYQSVALHRLLQKDKCLPILSRLMENEAAIPRRYLTLARLMDADLRPLKPDSLDEIARMMDDIHRRLDFGRAGKRVRKEEDDVIAKLDKMIEEMEDQLKQQQQQASGSGGSSSPSSPKQDSSPGGVKGPGNVDPKSIGGRSGWGDLPPKDRQEVLQQIGKDLPAHYRETIEAYFRKLARDGGRGK